MSQKKRTKFKVDTTKKGIRKRTFEGVVFASDMELKYYRDYLLPLKAKGEITSIVLQPKFMLQPKFVKYERNILPIYYVADFEVVYADGTAIVVDVKGLPTQEAKIKRKLFDYCYPEKRLDWVALSIQDGGWLQYDDLAKLRAKRKRGNRDAKKNS